MKTVEKNFPTEFNHIKEVTFRGTRYINTAYHSTQATKVVKVRL